MRRTEAESIERGTISTFQQPHHVRTSGPTACRECGQTRLHEHNLLKDGTWCVTCLSCGRVDARSEEHGARHSQASRVKRRYEIGSDVRGSLAALAIGATTAPPGYVTAAELAAIRRRQECGGLAVAVS